MGDLFHEDAPDTWIDRVFAVMALAPQHTYLCLTKRPARMRAYIADTDAYRRVLDAAGSLRAERGSLCSIPISDPMTGAWWPQTVLGVSVEDQTRADERRDDLAAIAAQGWTTLVSYEPALGPVDWTGWGFTKQIISGGESGPRARPSDGDWHRETRDWCAHAGVSYFFKQHGEFINVRDLRELPGGRGPGFGAYDHCAHDMETDTVRVGKKRAGRLLDGREHNEMPGCAHDRT